MFLENCGKFFFGQMRPPFFFALVLLPFIATALLLLQKYSAIADLENRFAAAARKEHLAFARKERKERFLDRYSSSDPYYLDREIESFVPLQLERDQLEAMLNHPALPASSVLEERILFLTQNRLLFTEEKMEVGSDFKEVPEKQRQPVQMDEHDLKEILSLIEDLPNCPAAASSKRPQILIKEFTLKKQETPLQAEVFEIDMHLLKREFTQR